MGAKLYCEGFVLTTLKGPTGEDRIEALCRRLGPLDQHQIAACLAMTPARCLELAFQVYQFAPDLPHEELA